MGFKYIMLEVNTEGTVWRLPVIFPDNFVHADVYEAMRMANRRSAHKSRLPWTDPKVVSAGKIESLSVEAAHGESETLQLKSQCEDKEIINSFQYMHGIQ